MTSQPPDLRAISSAHRINQALKPLATFLYGSRNHDDYHADSDLNLLLLVERLPTGEQAIANRHQAQAIADEEYSKPPATDQPVEVELYYLDAPEFCYERLFDNSVATKAVRHGLLIPGDPETFDLSDYQDEKTESEHDWSDYHTAVALVQARMLALSMHPNARAESPEQVYELRRDAVEAVLLAHKIRPKRRDPIAVLIGILHALDEELKDWQPHPDPDDLEGAVNDARTLLERAQNVYENQE